VPYRLEHLSGDARNRNVERSCHLTAGFLFNEQWQLLHLCQLNRLSLAAIEPLRFRKSHTRRRRSDFEQISDSEMRDVVLHVLKLTVREFFQYGWRDQDTVVQQTNKPIRTGELLQ